MSTELNPEKYFTDMERAWRYICKQGSKTQGIEGVKELRGYGDWADEELDGMDVYWIPENVVDVNLLKKLEMYDFLGLERISRRGGKEYKTGKFLLEGRYVFPVRSVMGKIYALIGWYPDLKKYITTPSALFSKNNLYYGMEQLGKIDKGCKPNLILVEGIFDSVAVRTLGVNNTVVLATMGSNISGSKKEIYRLFKNIIAVPDRDKTGRRNLNNDSWGIPIGGTQIRIIQTQELKDSGIEVKDIDDVVKLADHESLRDFFQSVQDLKTAPRRINLPI